MVEKLLIWVTIALTLATPASAQRANRGEVQPAPPAAAPCLQFYLGGRPPTAIRPAARDHRLFCRSFYALTYSTRQRNPVWTSYRLTRDMVQGADRIPRRSRRFAPQAGLTSAEQGNHDDYVHPPFHRGHMTPDNDAPNLAMQADTYVVSNIVPQIGGFNSGLWAQLESAVHRLAASEGEVFVVTGPIYAPSLTPMNGIAVPSHVFKAIFVPSRGFALAFISTNAHPTACGIVPVAEVQRLTEVDVFPSLPATAKARLPDLPEDWGNFPRRCRPAP